MALINILGNRIGIIGDQSGESARGVNPTFAVSPGSGPQSPEAPARGPLVKDLPIIVGRLLEQRQYWRGGPCPEGEIVDTWLEDPIDNPLDPTYDILHMLVKCPDEIGTDGLGGGYINTGGYTGGRGVRNPPPPPPKKNKVTLRSSRAFPPSKEQMSIIQSFLDDEILKLPCLSKVPWLKVCIESLLKSPPPLTIGVVQRKDTISKNVRDDDMDIWSQDVWRGNAAASKNSAFPGLVIKETLFGSNRRGYLKSIVFHELIHQCTPKPDEIEVEIFENLCFPSDDIIETEELEGINVTTIPGIDTVDSEGKEMPHLIKVIDGDGNVRILLVYDMVIIDPVSGDVWINGSGKKTFAWPNADPIIRGRFKMDGKKIAEWWEQVKDKPPQSDPWGGTKKKGNPPGLSFVRSWQSA